MPYYKKRRTGRSYGRRRYSRRKYYAKGNSTIRNIGYALNKYYRIQKAKAALDTISPALSTGEGAPTLWSYYDRARAAQVPVTLKSYLEARAASGRGSYGLGRSLGRAAGGLIGGALGSRRAGRAVGGFLGGAAGEMLGTGGYTAAGLGEYDLDSGPSNSLISGSSVAVPRMSGGDEIGSVVVVHKEYLGNITGSIQFENSSFELNPGLVGTFPWLSQIAQNYEEYSFEQLMFTYTSLLSDSTASGVIGSIIMTTNYNAGQPDFTNTSDMLNNIGTISARPIDGPIIHGIECDDTKNVLPSYYIRAGSVPAGQDIKTYDMGRFQLATEGMPVDDQLQGQLWVSYRITLRKPKIWTAAGKGIQQFLYKFRPADLNEQRQSTLFGTVGKVDSANNLDLKLNNTYANSVPEAQIVFPPTIVQGIFEIIITFMNPRDVNGNYPNSPALQPDWILSNMAMAVPQGNALYPDLFAGAQEPLYGQTYGTFSKAVEFKFPVKLLGSFAVPTYFILFFPQYPAGAKFFYDELQIRVHAINPLFTALSENNPPDWNAISVGTF